MTLMELVAKIMVQFNTFTMNVLSFEEDSEEMERLLMRSGRIERTKWLREQCSPYPGLKESLEAIKYLEAEGVFLLADLYYYNQKKKEEDGYGTACCPTEASGDLDSLAQELAKAHESLRWEKAERVREQEDASRKLFDLGVSKVKLEERLDRLKEAWRLDVVEFMKEAKEQFEK
jgi:hypothetical protein